MIDPVDVASTIEEFKLEFEDLDCNVTVEIVTWTDSKLGSFHSSMIEEYLEMWGDAVKSFEPCEYYIINTSKLFREDDPMNFFGFPNAARKQNNRSIQLWICFSIPGKIHLD